MSRSYDMVISCQNQSAGLMGEVNRQLSKFSMKKCLQIFINRDIHVLMEALIKPHIFT